MTEELRASGEREGGRESEIARFKGFHGDRVRLVRIELGSRGDGCGGDEGERGAGTTN